MMREPPTRPVVYGLILGAVYGLAARVVVETRLYAGAFGVMTLSFLFVVPPVIGYLTVRPVSRPSFGYSVLAPWLPCVLIVFAAGAIGLEGAICIVMATPLMLIMSSVGGLLGGARATRVPLSAMPLILALPYALAPLERHRALPNDIVVTRTEIVIDAPVTTVWPLVASVDSIRPQEMRRALFTSMGFPKPISATLSHPGVGGVRKARFTGGLVFTETVTDWQPGRRLSFTIRPNTSEIPPTTLDPHVTIGGPYFDVLTGTYELEPIGPNRTRLILFSRHRVSTPFNVYARWWADRVMRSIQSNILDVIRRRAARSL